MGLFDVKFLIQIKISKGKVPLGSVRSKVDFKSLLISTDKSLIH